MSRHRDEDQPDFDGPWGQRALEPLPLVDILLLDEHEPRELGGSQNGALVHEQPAPQT